MNKILENKSIIITRSKFQSQEFKDKLVDLGANVLVIPMIEIIPLINQEIISTFNKISLYDWIIFTSTNSIEIFFYLLNELQINQSELKNIKYAVVGNKTKDKLQRYGFIASLIPKSFTAHNILEEFKKLDIKESKILLPTSKIAKKDLFYALNNLGALTDFIAIYDNVKPDLAIDSKEVIDADYITFTSPSTVKNFYDFFKYDIDKIKGKIICIGSVTQNKVNELLKKESLIPNNFNVDGIIKLIIECEK